MKQDELSGNDSRTWVETMSQIQAAEKHTEVSIENIGDVDSTEITLSPGVASLTGWKSPPVPHCCRR